MNKLFVLLAALFGIVLSATPAAAGNHFLLELEAGVATPMGVNAEVDSGTSFAGTFGFGGRIPGFAPAYYVVGRIGQSGFAYYGPRSSGHALVDRAQFEYAIGGRMYLPITNRLRLFGQIALGETYDESIVTRTGHRKLLLEEDQFTVFTEAGLQFRVTNGFSLGGGADLSFVPDNQGSDLAANVAGIKDGGDFGRARFSVMGTFHF